MVAVAVTADNNRIAEAQITPDSGTWGNDGGGGGVADEPDIVYQGGAAQSRKVSTTLIGRNYTHGSGTDATATDRRHLLMKLNCTNFTALNTRATPGTELKVGSGSGAYYVYRLFGSDNYPLAGGWQFVALSPNVAGYRQSTTGSPSLTSVLYWSWLGDYTATAKAENHCIDAIDLGAGLKLLNGDGASADGVWADFLSADEGTSANRWGYIRSDKTGLIYFVNGRLQIGESATETDFTDATGQVLVWENGLVETGFHELLLDAQNANSVISITGSTFDSNGQKDNDGDRGYTTTEDSRLVITGDTNAGVGGTVDLAGCVGKNLSNIVLDAGCTIDDGDFQTESMTMGAAEIKNSILRTTSITNVGTITDPTFGVSSDLHDTLFLQEGAGHAMDIGSAGSYTFTGLTFTGYNASDGQSDSAVYCSAGSGRSRSISAVVATRLR